MPTESRTSRRPTTAPAPAAFARVWPLVALLLCGCGQKEVLEEVSGTVTFQSQPVSTGQVLFSNAEQGVHVLATIQPDGAYHVEMAQGYGLPPGAYRVAVMPPSFEVGMDVINTGQTVPQFSFIPERYRNPATSGVSLEVSEGPRRFDIEMQP